MKLHNEVGSLGPFPFSLPMSVCLSVSLSLSLSLTHTHIHTHTHTAWGTPFYMQTTVLEAPRSLPGSLGNWLCLQEAYHLARIAFFFFPFTINDLISS